MIKHLNRKPFYPAALLLLTACAAPIAAHAQQVPAPVVAPATAGPSFADFDRRAQAGDHLTVVFFGASLTWGANASDPINTSYRADVAGKLEQQYPNAHFHFYDAAIGGTGSQLAVFRYERDVLGRHPDLVFIDFSANDDIYSADPEASASYESLIRRLIAQAKIPVVQVIFPFKWNANDAELPKMHRRDTNLAIAKAYNVPTGDAIQLVIQRLDNGTTTLDTIWPLDGVHPGDPGYALFADAAFGAYLDAVKNHVVESAPPTMLYADTYMTAKRVRISTLGPLPQGWRVGMPNRVSAWYDGLMSRWLDDEVIASNRVQTVGPDGKKTLTPVTVAPLTVHFHGATVLLFGEETLKGGQYTATIDGTPVVNHYPADKTQPNLFTTSSLKMGGNRQHAQTLATGLDPKVEHTLTITPMFPDDTETEMRLESICVAGAGADVTE